MRHELATAVLGPLLARQGRAVRAHISQLAEPPGERTGTAGQGPELAVLVLGDSAGAGVGANSQAEALSGQLVAALAPHHTVRWALAARSGATVAAALRLLQQRPAESWDWVVVSLGANDVVAGRSLSRWRSDLTDLHLQLDEQCGQPRLLFSGLPPLHLFPALPQPLRWYLGARAREFDRELQRWAAGRERCEWLASDYPADRALLATDGFHPGPGLYRLWGQAAADHLRGPDTHTSGAHTSGAGLTPAPESGAVRP